LGGRAGLALEELAGITSSGSKVISALIDPHQFAYVPLEYYDLDRQIAHAARLTLGRLFVPFDLVSRAL